MRSKALLVTILFAAVMLLSPAFAGEVQQKLTGERLKKSKATDAAERIKS